LKKTFPIHLFVSVIISVYVIYNVIYVKGFYGSLIFTILKEIGETLVLYWAGVSFLWIIKSKLVKGK
tara:strand:- start:444 stop:644 length:201 start_codon:yes stop_codon:yes gene_type:complete